MSNYTTSYCDLAWAEQYFTERSNSDNWNDATEAEKTAALATATRDIARYAKFSETVTDARGEETVQFFKYAYDGSVKKPTVTVKDGSTKLKEGTHYTVKYSSGCKKIGEYKVTLTFKGNYTGTKTLEYQIAPAKVNYKKIKATQSTKAITLSWPKIDGATGYYVYQYSEKKDKYVKVGPVPKAKFKKEKLKAGTE